MKVIVYMAPTVNGFIAKENDDVDFVSDAEFRWFLRKMKQVGCDVIGRRTYERALKDGWFPYKRAFHVVMTKRHIKSRWTNVIFTNSSPNAVLELLERKGFKAVLVGGGRLAGDFMERGLVDELIVDIEPRIFGEGIKLFGDSDLNVKLRFLSAKKLSKNEIQLRYSVVKGR